MEALTPIGQAREAVCRPCLSKHARGQEKFPRCLKTPDPADPTAPGKYIDYDLLNNGICPLGLWEGLAPLDVTPPQRWPIVSEQVVSILKALLPEIPDRDALQAKLGPLVTAHKLQPELAARVEARLIAEKEAASA